METPSDFHKPTFLMNFPLSVSNRVPNNVWMDPDEQGPFDMNKATTQWMELYWALIDLGSLVYVLPGHNNLQDLPYVANLGCYLPHLHNTILLANFMSIPRRGEDIIGRKFFSHYKYKVKQPLAPWEGEADLKWVRSNIYVGGIGSRSTAAAFRWMASEFDMEITTISMTDPKLYHLDCVYFPLDEHKAIVNVAAINPEDMRKLEKLTEIIPVPNEYVYQGWTNVLRVGRHILHAPAKLPWEPFGKLLDYHGYNLRIFDLTEFDKSGADLSCLVMHMNVKNRF